MAQKDLNSAARNKNDEFYTIYEDIQKELNCYFDFDNDVFKDKVILLPCDDPDCSNFTKFFVDNFKRFKIKKLISTSYAKDSNGKIFIMNSDEVKNYYLECDGDFRSDEVKNLRDESDIIITNPPFSLFREFLKWIINADKKFLIIGNINCITYKEVFPLIKENKIWLGNGMSRWISGFIVPEGYELYGSEARIKDGERIVATNNCLWLTNLEHGRRHKPLKLMTMAQNLNQSRHKIIRDQGYQRYDNYNAIEVPFVDAIPKDYDGVMGVPITFLDKYCPEQFEILGHTYAGDTTLEVEELRTDPKNRNRGLINGKIKYDRILIKRRR